MNVSAALLILAAASVMSAPAMAAEPTPLVPPAPAATPAPPAALPVPTALECPAIDGQTLVYISVFDGPPEKNADLAPDRYVKRAGITTNTWQLYRDPDGRYVKCGYGKSLAGPYNVIETIKLPDTAKTCHADYKPGPGAGDLTLQKFSCQ
jgi:hypothetical protein